jgi:hypothetical protein
MARIEVRRLARNPFFILANVVTFGLLVWFVIEVPAGEKPGELLSWPVVPAFFVGLTSLVLLARQTRSTEAAAEAMSAAPGTEADRTLALCVAALLPGLSGLVFSVATVVIAAVNGVAPQEWWFGTLPDIDVWAMMLALAPVACLGGGLLGVVVGRWLRFPGAAAVVVIVLVVVDMLGNAPAEEGSHPVLRLWTVWASFGSGTNDDGSETLYGGNPVGYLVYVVCLCVAAVLFAVWHDRSARTARLRGMLVATVVVGLLGLTLAMTTGTSENRVSDPISSRAD